MYHLFGRCQIFYTFAEKILTVMIRKLIFTAFLCACGAFVGVHAQVMKTSDLENYAKEKYGDKWLDAAANLAKGLHFDKNQSLTYQQVIEAPGKTKDQLYVTLNYWVTATRSA